MTEEDCVIVTRIIHDNLRYVNSRDYSEEIINHMCKLFTPAYITEIAKTRNVYVIVKDSEIVGTASLDQDTIYTVFVDVKHHRSGIGRKLIQHVEHVALQSEVTQLKLPSSITGQGFYEKLGYKAVQVIESEEFGRDIIMSKDLKIAE
jgi:histone acetyltransferase (RNA polymerase elongator complex component)